MFRNFVHSLLCIFLICFLESTEGQSKIHGMTKVFLSSYQIGCRIFATKKSDLKLEIITYCSFIFSQKSTQIKNLSIAHSSILGNGVAADSNMKQLFDQSVMFSFQLFLLYFLSKRPVGRVWVGYSMGTVHVWVWVGMQALQ